MTTLRFAAGFGGCRVSLLYRVAYVNRLIWLIFGVREQVFGENGPNLSIP